MTIIFKMNEVNYSSVESMHLFSSLKRRKQHNLKYNIQIRKASVLSNDLILPCSSDQENEIITKINHNLELIA